MKKLTLVVVISFCFTSFADAAFRRTQRGLCGVAFGTVVSQTLVGQSTVPLLPKYNAAIPLPKQETSCPLLPGIAVAGFLASGEVLKTSNPSLKLHYFASADGRYSFCVPSEYWRQNSGELILRDMNLTDQELPILAQILMNHKYVTSVDLCENFSLTPDGVITFLEGLPHIEILHVPVWLSWNRWGDDDDLERIRAKLEQMGIESHIVPGRHPDDED